MIVDDSAAMNELTRLALPDECPALRVEEVDGILARHKRADLWSAATVVNLGSRIIPTLAKRNEHRFKAVAYVSGTSNQQTGATEPTWTTTRDGQVTDGSVIWQEDGWDWDAVLWDFTAAAREAWLLKASKSVRSVDVEDPGGLSVKGSQLYDHCMSQANRFVSAYVL